MWCPKKVAVMVIWLNSNYSSFYSFYGWFTQWVTVGKLQTRGCYLKENLKYKLLCGQSVCASWINIGSRYIPLLRLLGLHLFWNVSQKCIMREPFEKVKQKEQRYFCGFIAEFFHSTGLQAWRLFGTTHRELSRPVFRAADEQSASKMHASDSQLSIILLVYCTEVW